MIHLKGEEKAPHVQGFNEHDSFERKKKALLCKVSTYVIHLKGKKNTFCVRF